MAQFLNRIKLTEAALLQSLAEQLQKCKKVGSKCDFIGQRFKSFGSSS